MGFEPGLALMILGSSIRVAVTVKFKDQIRSVAEEVNNVRSDHDLAAELCPREATVSKRVPEPPLRKRHVSS